MNKEGSESLLLTCMSFHKNIFKNVDGWSSVFILQLADRPRVDASVKLKFKDIRGRSCVVTRRIMQSKGAKVKYSISKICFM